MTFDDSSAREVMPPPCKGCQRGVLKVTCLHCVCTSIVTHVYRFLHTCQQSRVGSERNILLGIAPPWSTPGVHNSLSPPPTIRKLLFSKFPVHIAPAIITLSVCFINLNYASHLAVPSSVFKPTQVILPSESPLPCRYRLAVPLSVGTQRNLLHILTPLYMDNIRPPQSLTSDKPCPHIS